MKILITGGAGYIGSMLVKLLFQSKLPIEKLTVYDNLMYRQTSLMEFCHKREFELVRGDVRDQDLLLPAVKEADIIIPLAAIVGAPACARDKALATQVNYEQIRFLVENTSRNQGIIYPNTDSAYGCTEGSDYCTEETPLEPTSHYGVVKVQGEKVLRDSGRGVVLRLATVFGVSARMRLDLLINDFTYKAVTDRYIVLFEGNFKRNFVHVQDVASAFVFAAEHYDQMNSDVFNAGNTSANMTKMELCQMIKKHLPYFSIQVDEFGSDPDKRNYQVLNAKLESLGWQCRMSVDDGINELIKAYQMVIHSNRNYTNL